MICSNCLNEVASLDYDLCGYCMADERTHRREGDWMATITGTKWFVIRPHPDDVKIDDIAHGLAMVCRFGGHCRRFHSVAQHSVLMANELERLGAAQSVVLWALLHDAPEAYIGDMVRPLKYALDGYREIEVRTERAIMEGLGLPMPEKHVRETVKAMDDRMLMTERRDLMNHCGIAWTPRAEPLPETIMPWRPEEARQMFKKSYFGIRFPEAKYDEP